MNILTAEKKLFICEVAIYIYEMERQERVPKRFIRVERSGTFAQIAKFKFWQTFRGKPSLFKLGS